jgi:hypothetical protein
MNLKEIQAIDDLLTKHQSAAEGMNLGTALSSKAAVSMSTEKQQKLAFTLTDICTTLTVITPMLKFVVKYLLFWKPSWQVAVNGFIDKLNVFCELSAMA